MREHVSLGGFATFVNCLAVSPTTPAKGFDEFVQWVRSHPGKANIGVLSDCGHGGMVARAHQWLCTWLRAFTAVLNRLHESMSALPP